MRGINIFKTAKKGDRTMALLCAVIFTASALFFAARFQSSSRPPKTIVITVGGEIADTINIDEAGAPFERVYRTPAGFNIVRMDGGGASVVSADCPDLICVRRGRLSARGDTAACLPHRFLVRVLGEGGKEGSDGGTH